MRLSSALQRLVLEETVCPDGCLQIFAQPEHLQELNLTTSLLNAHPDAVIEHIICINNNKTLIKSQQNYNVQCLKKVVPFYGMLCGYKPFYYYDSINSHFNNLNLFPCLFLTKKAAVLCSSNLREGILFKDPFVLSLLAKRFQNILQETTPLTQEFSSGISDTLKAFSPLQNSSADVYSLAAEPCLAPFFTPELIKKYIYKELPHRELLLQSLTEYTSSFPTGSHHTYFTKEGILNFLSTGRLSEIPSEIYFPLQPSDRIFILKKLYEYIEKTSSARLLNGPLEKFPMNLHINITSNYGYLMFSKQNGKLTYIILKEQNILNAFYDFTASLKENDMLCSESESLEFLKGVIQDSF